MRSAYLWGLGLCLLVASCAKVNDPDPDKNTNWLRQCSDDHACGSGLSCECGRCTTTCEVAADCGHRPLGYACEPTSGRALRAQCAGEQDDSVEAVCVARCKQSSDCPSRDGLSCRDGLCVSDPPPSDAGTAPSDAGTMMTSDAGGAHDAGMDGGPHKPPPVVIDQEQPPLMGDPPFWDEDSGVGGPCTGPFFAQRTWFATCACAACGLECLDTFGDRTSCLADFDQSWVSPQCHSCLEQASAGPCLGEALQCADQLACGVSGAPQPSDVTCVQGMGSASSGSHTPCETEFHDCTDGKARMYQCQFTGNRFECNCFIDHTCSGQFSVPASKPNIEFCQRGDLLAPMCGFRLGGGTR